MLTEHVVYSIRCDKCDTQFVKNEKIFYNDKATLLREAESNEWINSSNMHFCPHCYNTCKDTITSLIKEANFWIDVIVLKGLHTYEEACRLVPDGYRLPTVDDFKKLSQD